MHAQRGAGLDSTGSRPHASLSLTLNGMPIAETGAARIVEADGVTRAEFNFRVDSLWPLLGRGDRLQVLPTAQQRP
jgi:hypothetical protein